jgi:hypothetical protein
MSMEQLMQIVGTVLIRAEDLEQLSRDSTMSQADRAMCMAEARGLRNSAELVAAWISEQEGSLKATKAVCLNIARATRAVEQGCRHTIGEPDPQAELRQELVSLQGKILSGHGDEADRARVQEIKAQL